MAAPWATIIAAALKSGAGIASGIGSIKAAKAMQLTEDQQAELAALERTEGLTDQTRGALEERFLQQQAGAQRQLEASGLQQAAARGLSGGVSGREVFLQEVAEAEAARTLRQQQTEVLEAARTSGQERAAALRLQEQQAEAARQKAIWATVSGAFGGAGEVAGGYASGVQQVQLAEAQAGVQDTSALLDQLEEEAATRGFTLMQGI